MPLLLILSAIAVVCAVVLWRYSSLARTLRRASREQARQTDGSARTGTASARAPAASPIEHAHKGPGQPQATPRIQVSAALQRTAAPAASVPAPATAAAELQGDDPWLDTVPGERLEPSDSAAALSEVLPSTSVANERINADVNAVSALPAESSGNADRDYARTGLAASPAPAAPPIADAPLAMESTAGAVHQPGSGTVAIAAASAAQNAQPAEATMQEAGPDTLLADSGEQQFASDWTATDQVPDATLTAERETSAASQPFLDASIEPGPAADPPEPLPGVAPQGQKLTSPQTEHDRPDHTAEPVEPQQSEDEPAAAAEGPAVEQPVPATLVHEPAATAATAADAIVVEATAVAQPAAAETAPSFVPNLAAAGLGSESPASDQRKAPTQAEGELGTNVSAARADAAAPVVAQMEAPTQASSPKAETVALAERQTIAQTGEATTFNEADQPALATSSQGTDQDGESATGRMVDLQQRDDNAAPPEHPAQPSSETTEEASAAASDLDDLDALLCDALSRPARQAVHRDRRGRQASPPPPGTERKRATRQSNTLRPPAEARLRLMLHPIRRTVGLTLILMRPAEFPERVTLELNGSQTVDALEESQYGDVDLTWDTDLLANEIRVSCAEGHQWVRGARPVHIFAADPAQADLVSVSAATVGTEHTIICRDQDAGMVCDIAESAGSARPQPLCRFSGIPDGWVVLSDYRPTRAAALQPAQAFSPLDPGHSQEITLQGGLEVGHRLYAQGKPPRIRIEPALDGIAVRIGGATAAVAGDGAWEAPGWDTPGQHRVEVVPGPSLNYEIQVDPAMQGGWTFWDAHSGRTADDEKPWSRAQICGAQLSGPSGERVIAAELQPSILALGIDGTVGALRPRGEAGVSVGFAAGMPAFLLMSSGRRRRQGKIVWLGLPQFSEAEARPRRLSEIWIEAVRSAAARRLTMQADEGGVGQSIWHKAVLLARSAKRQRHG